MLKTTFVELLLYAIHAAVVVGTFWIVVGRDNGRSCFIRCGLVIMMYLIATSPLALRWTFIQGITDDETQETTYIYSRGWILLSSISFMADILITSCIAIWQCWVHSGRKWMFAVIPGLCIIVGTTSAGVGLYQMAVTNPPVNACAAQIDWMLPYFSMVVAVTLSCTLVTFYHIMMDRCIGGRILRLWIKVIVESSLLFAAAPVAYIMSDTHTGCPLLVVTMIMSLAPILAIAQIPSNPRRRGRMSENGGNAGSASGENREDSAI
ncbi:hypothetical protein ARMGADRAFT_183967 [Armillaria gallica]|uniref:Uncharacterized protein n=1 Tax=Armillaria gallica TaxID=47427 RepID=A0A2H3DN60_ARMGA|nr:hypothetical protein ARMGADRAFT_183967 [Armillaria gallica]